MRPILIAAAVLLAAPIAHAQFFEVYGNVSDVHANNVPVTMYPPCPVLPIDPCTPYNGTTSNSSFTGGGGVTLNFLNAGVAKLGLDLRGSKHYGTTGTDTGFAGIKFTVKPPFLRVTPYIQASGGYLGTHSSNRSDQYIAAELLGGIDVPLLAILDLRLIEIGGGHAVTTSGGSKPTFVTAGAGLVLHF